jgi:hypothetical protein
LSYNGKTTTTITTFTTITLLLYLFIFSAYNFTNITNKSLTSIKHSTIKNTILSPIRIGVNNTGALTSTPNLTNKEHIFFKTPEQDLLQKNRINIFPIPSSPEQVLFKVLDNFIYRYYVTRQQKVEMSKCK